MPQLFNTSSTTLSSEKPAHKASEKRTFSGTSISTNKPTHGPNTQVGTKIKNFFRISSNSSNHESKDKDTRQVEPSASNKTDLKTTLRHSKLMRNIGSRHRSTTVASEGNPLEDSMSPTLNANPYFQHQGPPTLRHHNDNSVPPSPPEGHGKLEAGGDGQDQQLTAGREELARKLRKVASAPNVQGLLASSKSPGRPQSNASLLEPAVGQHSNSSTPSVIETTSDNGLLPVPSEGIPSAGQLRQSIAFRRTYSSNSIKVRNVEVSPSSFEKVKLIGKGDVGKVYLVKEYKSQRLYAMKGPSANARALAASTKITSQS